MWKKFVMSSALDNPKKHIKKTHPELIPDETYIHQEIANKQAKDKGAASMSMVKFMKPLSKQHEVDITRWLYLNGIPFNVLPFPGFWAIHEKHCDNYTVPSGITFNDNVTLDYRCFVIACTEKLTSGIEKHHGEPFIHVMHDMVTLKNYLGASV